MSTSPIGLLRLGATALAALATAACATSADAGPNSGKAPNPTATRWPVIQHRSLGCGDAIDAPAAPSTPQDPVQLAITHTSRAATSIAAAYAITSPIKNEMLTLAIAPTAPTILLMRDATIVGYQRRDTDTIDGHAATGYPIGTKPYTGTLTLDDLCPNAEWTQIWQHPEQYSIEIIMSRQPSSGPQTAPPPSYIPDPLTIATTALPQ